MNYNDDDMETLRRYYYYLAKAIDSMSRLAAMLDLPHDARPPEPEHVSVSIATDDVDEALYKSNGDMTVDDLRSVLVADGILPHSAYGSTHRDMVNRTIYQMLIASERAGRVGRETTLHDNDPTKIAREVWNLTLAFRNEMDMAKRAETREPGTLQVAILAESVYDVLYESADGMTLGQIRGALVACGDLPMTPKGSIQRTLENRVLNRILMAGRDKGELHCLIDLADTDVGVWSLTPRHRGSMDRLRISIDPADVDRMLYESIRGGNHHDIYTWLEDAGLIPMLSRNDPNLGRLKQALTTILNTGVQKRIYLARMGVHDNAFVYTLHPHYRNAMLEADKA